MTTLDEIEARFASQVGAEFAPVSRVISHRDIAALARAIGSENALYWDEEFARTTRWGGVIAPPTMMSTIRAGSAIDGDLGLPVLNGGNRFTYDRPIRPGDVISGSAAVTEVRMKESEKGRMLFLVKRTTYVNQRNERVGAFEHVRIVREPST